MAGRPDLGSSSKLSLALLNSEAHFCTVNKVGASYPNAVVIMRKAASYEPRRAILGIWDDTWLTRGKYGIYVAARGSYGTLTGST